MLPTHSVSGRLSCQEVMMKKCLAIVVLLLASTAAQAQYTIEYGGRTIRIDPDRGTVSIPGVYDNTDRPTKRSKNEDADRTRKPTPQQAKTDLKADPKTDAQTAPGPVEQSAAVPAAPAPAPAAPATAPATATAAVAPAETAATAPPAPPPPAPPVQQEATPAAPSTPPSRATVTQPAPPSPQKQAAVPVAEAPPPSTSPLGVWLTEEKEGKVRIEQCGANLCGYSVDKKSNQNGEQVLINMKPGKDNWSGRILDPNSGSTYDSTIALKGPETLRVQGCAFGGMFCGGQTWTRVN
jgi:uncharacterized protein (DUF2147 family)